MEEFVCTRERIERQKERVREEERGIFRAFRVTLSGNGNVMVRIVEDFHCKFGAGYRTRCRSIGGATTFYGRVLPV